MSHKISFSRYLEIRDEYVKILRHELIGPTVGEAFDSCYSQGHGSEFIFGVLYSKKDDETSVQDNLLLEEQNDDPEESDDGLRINDSMILAHTRKPRSMGLTFQVEADALKKIECDISFVYFSHSLRKEVSDTVCIELKENSFNELPLRYDDVQLKITVLNKKLNEKTFYLAVTITNESENIRVCAPFLRIKSGTNSFIFKNITNSFLGEASNKEDANLAMLYRNKPNYAVGLGVSSSWNIQKGLGEIFTTFSPAYEVPSMNFDLPVTAELDPKILTMRYLSDICGDTRQVKCSKLEQFVFEYENWIKQLENKKQVLPDIYKDAATENLKHCVEAKNRMLEGIHQLRINDMAWRAFELANKSMLMQRIHLDVHSRFSYPVYPGDEALSKILHEIDYLSEEHAKYAWRPFQLAFLLLSIKSVVDDQSTDRDLVDLIWFPTGGGKTEAYLGLTAFTICYRRFAYPNNCSGTTVMMRYTLRLLTAQQFNRASTLIAALEKIRRDEAIAKPSKFSLGSEEISIGLWIGKDQTPNTLSDAKRYSSKMNTGLNKSPAYLQENLAENNKFQVLKCPWCGTQLTPTYKDKKLVGYFGYEVTNKSVEIRCTNPECCFSHKGFGKLPIQVVDEVLYKQPPTLLFGTVDKFASLATNSNVGSFFGLKGNRSPELIIQDELHLISGSLGTVVGIYETALDAICTYKGNRPKVVASTATIRRAKEQCLDLYNREVRQFPPPGVDAEDSFFAKENEIDHSKGKFGRLYVGLFAPGQSKATAVVRVVSALLLSLLKMDLSEDEKDYLWTLTGYFNSLRDLGKVSSLIDDDIQSRINGYLRKRWRIKSFRYLKAKELTSRITSTDLNKTLELLEHVGYGNQNAVDILLATNMISVGVDISRLNSMFILGQPKLTSEYIQASSRVGRKLPGIVFTLFDSSRSRDLSHYESFKSFHSAYYRYVEPTGVTPFSSPVRDRALHAVLVGVLRQINPSLSDCPSAFNRIEMKDDIHWVKKFVIDRYQSLRNRQACKLNRDESTEIDMEMDKFFEEWTQMADEYGKTLSYWTSLSDRKKPTLLKPFEELHGFAYAKETMTSMRHVDRNLKGELL